MKKVFLGVGHGGNDPGAVGYLKEADVNLNMALACRDYLVANNVDVQMSRIKDENDDLNEEVKECNIFNPDLAVDIHNNAGKGKGFEVFHSIKDDGSKLLAQYIEEEVKAIRQNSRGCKTKINSKGNADYYGFIRNTNCIAVITEGVFVDNAEDAAKADTLEEQKAFGVAYAKGILKYLGISTKNNTQQTQTTKSIVDLANEVIAGKYGTGEARKQALGALYNEVQAKVNEILKGNKTVVNEYYPIPNYKGSSIVDALNLIGVDSSFNNRKKIAQKNNVRDYVGTAKQNNQLLIKIKAGKLKK